MVDTFVADVFEPKWTSLSEEHSEVQRKLQEAIRYFIEGKKVTPTCIVGPYGVGKTELIFDGFRYAWKNGIPAFYTTLREILKFLPGDSISEQELPGKINAIIEMKIKKILGIFESNEILPEGIFLPDAKGRKIMDYFNKFGDVIGKNAEYFKDVIEDNEHCILFIDEMEEGWKGKKGEMGLNEKVIAQTGCLRALFEEVEKRQTNFYFVAGFGVISLYELLGQAEASRQVTINIPLLKIEALCEYLQTNKLDSAIAKFIWWASRGRPRWVKKLLSDHESDMTSLKSGKFDFSEFLNNISRTEIENVPTVDYSTLSDLRDKDADKALTELIFLNPCMIKTNALPKLAKKNMIFVISNTNDMVPIEDVVYAFSEDIKEIAQKKNIDIDDNRIRVYLKRILGAISSDGKMITGGWNEKMETFSYGFIAPILLLLHDFMLEFEGEGSDEDEHQKRQKNNMDLFYDLITDLGIASGSIADRYMFAQSFHRTIEFFKEVSNPQVWQPSLNMVEKIFPRIIVKPNISRKDIKELRNEFEGYVQGSSNFLMQTIEYDNISVEMIFLPSKNLMSNLIQRCFRTWDEYLIHNKIFYVLSLCNGLEEIGKLDKELFLLKEVKKLHFENIVEKRLQEFIISASGYDSFDKIATSEFFKIIDNLSDSEATPKIVKRTIQHYGPKLEDIFKEKAKYAVDSYKNELQDIVPFNVPSFPKDELKLVLTERRPEQTIDWIILAFGINSDKNELIDIFTELRSISAISGYKKFIEDNTATIRPRGLYVGMRTLSDFLKNTTFKHAKNLIECYSSSMVDVEDTRMNDTPLEILLNPKDDVEKTFLKALTLVHLLDDNKITTKLNTQLVDLKSKVKFSKEFEDKVEEFNKKMKNELFSSGEIKGYTKGLEKLVLKLEKASLSTPSKYIIGRILEQTINTFNTKYNGAGTAFNSVWRDFKEILEDVERAENDIKEKLLKVYKDNKQLKEDILGNVDEKIKGFKDNLTAIKNELIKKVGSLPIKLDEEKDMPSEIRSKINESRQKIESISIEMNTISEECTKTDKISTLNNEINDKLSEVHNNILGGGDNER